MATWVQEGTHGTETCLDGNPTRTHRSNTSDQANLCIGARVCVSSINREGTIRWLGEFKGEYNSVHLAGVEMDKRLPSGHDGTHKKLGKLFDCTAGFGIFVPQEKCKTEPNSNIQFNLTHAKDHRQREEDLKSQVISLAEELKETKIKYDTISEELKDEKQRSSTLLKNVQELNEAERLEKRIQKESLEHLRKAYDGLCEEHQDLLDNMERYKRQRTEASAACKEMQEKLDLQMAQKIADDDDIRIKNDKIKELEDALMTLKAKHENMARDEDQQHYYVAHRMYNKVKDKLGLPNNPTVLCIVNPDLRQRFEQKQKEFIAKYGVQRKEASPVLLFYWDAESINVFDILRANFKVNDLHQGNSKGILFSECPRVKNKLLLCQVLPGRPNNVRDGHWSMTNDQIQGKYDSECSNWRDGKCQLIWNEAQVLPFYLIIC